MKIYTKLTYSIKTFSIQYY